MTISERRSVTMHPSTPRCRPPTPTRSSWECQKADLGDGVVRTPLRPETVGARLEIRLEDRLQHQLQGRLHHPVGDGRDAQPAQLADPGLGDHPFPHRQRTETARPSTDPAARSRNSSTPCRSRPRRRSCRRPRPCGRPCCPRTRSHATNRNAGSVTRLNRSSNRRSGSSLAQRCSLVWISSTRCLGPQQADRSGHSVFTGVSPGIPALRLLTCWPPSPCDRLSRPRTTTAPPPRPVPSADDVPARPPRWLHGGEGDTGRFPRSPRCRSTRSRRPALPLRHRHGYAADLHRGLPAGRHIAPGVPRHRTAESGTHRDPAHIRQI